MRQEADEFFGTEDRVEDVRILAARVDGIDVDTGC